MSIGALLLTGVLALACQYDPYTNDYVRERPAEGAIVGTWIPTRATATAIAAGSYKRLKPRTGGATLGFMDLPRLYKLSEAKFAQALVSNGSVRVGTLFGFRLAELDEERRDAGEGTLTLHSPPGRTEYSSSEQLPPMLKGLTVHGHDALVTIGENAFVANTSVPDMFIYCMSESTEALASKRWGADSYATIVDPPGFLHALDLGLRREMSRRGVVLGQLEVARCVYEDRRYNWHVAPPHPTWLLKPQSYAVQREWRAAWSVVSPVGQALEPVLLCVPEVVGTCRIEDR